MPTTTKLAMRASVAADMRGCFYSQDLAHADTRLAELVTAIGMETSEEWETGKTYPTLTHPNRIISIPNHQKTKRLKSNFKSILKTFIEKKLLRFYEL
jgi:hypothetical protein